MKDEKTGSGAENAPKAKILREDDGKRIPPAHVEYITGGKNPAHRPEQGPEVPPQERTEGIP